MTVDGRASKADVTVDDKETSMLTKRLPLPLRPLLGLAIATLLLLGSASAAHAQYYGQPQRGYGGYPPPPPPPPPTYRSGLVLGFGLGIGGITASDCAPGFCGAALAGEFHLGGILAPRLALMGDVWGNIRGIDNTDGSLSQSFWSVAAQYWALDNLWLKGGLGIAHVQVDSASAGLLDDETALGLTLAAGLEVLRSGNMILDLQGRFGRGFYDAGGVNNFAFLVALNWY
jgi:opacity protein-like surface antigen